MIIFQLLIVVAVVVAVVSADYGGGHPAQQNVIVLPAGLSKAHHWIGVGDHDPIFVPKFFKAPRWIPDLDPTYTASWVPFAPEPRHQTDSYESSDSNIIPQGFGHPKGSSIMTPHFNSNPSIAVSQVGGFPAVNPHSSSNSYHSATGALQIPQQNHHHRSDNFPARSYEFPLRAPPANTRHSRASYYQQPTTIHVGSPHPGASPPSALGINYNTVLTYKNNLPNFPSNGFNSYGLNRRQYFPRKNINY